MVRSVSPTDLAQKAFVRGLSDEADEDTLRRTFAKFGEVVEVHIAKDRDTNASRGFAFITFTSSTDCNKACTAMDGKDFQGRILHVELASHFNKSGGGRGGFRGSRGRSSFRGGRGRGRGSSRSPPRDMSYRRGGGTSRGSWRGGSGGRGDFRNYGSRMSDSFYPGEDRFRSSVDRDPPRDYGSRYDSEYRSARPERDYAAARDYSSYRARDYPGGDRDYGPPPRERDYPSYYSPPRDYPPSDRDYPPPRGRDYPPGGRDYQLSRADHDLDMGPRRYGSRDYDYPPGNGFYDSHPPRRDYGPPARDYGSSGRYDSYEGGGRTEYKSRGSFSGRGSRDMDYARGMPARRPPRDDDRPAGMRRPLRTPDGPPPKKMKMGEPLRRSPHGGDVGRRY